MCFENKNNSMLFPTAVKIERSFILFVFFYAVQFHEKKIIEEQKTNRQKVIGVA